MNDNSTKGPVRRGRPRKGTLQLRGQKYWARVTLTIDGETVRKLVNLETSDKQAANRKLKKLLAKQAPDIATVRTEAKRGETFAEAAERTNKSRVTLGVKSAPDEMARLRAYASDLFEREATTITTGDVNRVLDGARDAGKSRQTVQHLRQDLRNVFATLKREQAIAVNPVDECTMPRFAETTHKVRAVLSDEELFVYISWSNPEERFAMASLERQVMAVVSRLFGGLRTGDLHALTWDRLDTPNFTWGWAPRKKTKAPQRLAIPAMLRPVLADWWTRAGKPTEGPVFPTRRGDRAGEARGHASHALAFRRDLRRAFGIDALLEEGVVRSNGRPDLRRRWHQVRDLTPREIEIFEEGPYHLPVDFHSWRRSFTQALADADVNAQQAQALAGHASLAAHQRYLANASKIQELPEAALPRIGISALGGASNQESEMMIQQETSGRDRSRTCDIRLVRLLGRVESSTKQGESLQTGGAEKHPETPGNGSLVPIFGAENPDGDPAVEMWRGALGLWATGGEA